MAEGTEFKRSAVKLVNKDSWCYHEGSYGHNPEYGRTDELKMGDTVFWKVHSSGEAMVPKDVSSSGSIGFTHSVQLTGPNVVVDFTNGRNNKTSRQTFDVQNLWTQFQDSGNMGCVNRCSGDDEEDVEDEPDANSNEAAKHAERKKNSNEAVLKPVSYLSHPKK